jgi:hypothetical protein
MWRYQPLRAGLVLLVVLLLLYAPVVFLSKSLQPGLYYSDGVVHTGPYDYESRRPVNVFNVELATPAYYERPQNRLVGDFYRRGELPLWNPYQAAGQPLLAQYSSSVFFPYQVAEDISPTVTWDFWMIGRLWLAGMFTFLFLRSVRASPFASVLGGLLYMLSGTFVWYINLEQLVNVAMVTPLLLWTVEGLWRWSPYCAIPALAVATALVLLGGQPETALYVLLLGAAYSAVRWLQSPVQERLPLLARGVLGTGIGLALAAPLLVPFAEFVPRSFSIHPPALSLGTQDPTEPSLVVQLFVPSLFRIPVAERIFPDNGQWDYTGGYTGVVTPLLIIAGLVAAVVQQRSPNRVLLLFFTGFAVALLLKNFGSPLALWVGDLPLLSRAWTNRWAAPAWAFPVAVAAALSMDTIRAQIEGAEIRPRLARWWREHGQPAWARTRGWATALAGATVVIGVLLIGLAFASVDAEGTPCPPTANTTCFRNVVHGDYFFAAAWLGVIVAGGALISALVVIRQAFLGRSSLIAIAVIALAELWFAIPQGYDSATAPLLLVPLALAFGAAYAAAKSRWPLVSLLALGFLGTTLAIDSTAPFGLPERADPFAAPPYAQFLKGQEDVFRVTGGDGVLIPNHASVLALQDVRYISALSVDDYQQFKDRYLHIDRLDRFNGVRLWFTGGDVRYTVSGLLHRSFWEDIKVRQRYYSFLGVRYILAAPPPPRELAPPATNVVPNGLFLDWPHGGGPFIADQQETAGGWFLTTSPNARVAVTRGGPAEGGTGEILRTDVAAPGDGAALMQTLRDLDGVKGKTVTWSALVRSDAAGVARLNLSIQDEEKGFAGGRSAFYPGGGSWVRLAVTSHVPEVDTAAIVLLIEFTSSGQVEIRDASLTVGDASFALEEIRSGFPLVYEGEIHIYQNPEAFPRAFLVGQVDHVESPERALDLISDPSYDLRRRAAVDGPVPSGFLTQDDLSGTPVLLSPSQDVARSGGVGSVEIRQYTPHRVILEAEALRPALLVLTDTYFPGWRAAVDGHDVEILRVNGAFRGVPLTPGSHTIEFNYEPKSVRRGILLAVAGLALIAVLLGYASGRAMFKRLRGSRGGR